MVDTPFADRTEAGAALAQRLHAHAGRDDVVLHALPRGGVPVAYEIARRLDLPLDVTIVRKVGVPGHEELAMAAVASGGVLVRNEDVIGQLGIDDDTLESRAAPQREEVRARERRFRGNLETPAVEGKTVIVVDDGIATGSTVKAALRALRQRDPEEIVLAVPVAPAAVIGELEDLADEVHCLLTPRVFGAVGMWYRRFDQVPDETVRNLLEDAPRAA